MWLMMGVEQPALTAIVARLPNASINLAAFGVTFALALVVESPVIQMLSAATALAKSRRDYHSLLKAMHVMAAGLTAVHLLLGLTPLYDLVMGGLLGVPADVIDRSRASFVLMAPFAAFVGYRRLWQGILIRLGKTSIVTVTMLLRLVATMGFLFVGFAGKLLPGAELAAASLILGTLVGALASFFFARPAIRGRLPAEPPAGEVLSSRRFLRFYIPLASTSVIFLAANPLLTFGMARSVAPLESLATWPVINGFMFLFNSVALSYQEAVIALLERGFEEKLRRFSYVLGPALGLFLLLAGVTPFGDLWFRGVAGLEADLIPFTRVPLLILTAVPILVTQKSWMRGLFVHRNKTVILAQSVSIYTVVLLLMVLIVPVAFGLEGTIVAALSLAVAQMVENVYLFIRRRGGLTRP